MQAPHRPYRIVLQTILVVWLIVAASTVAWKWYTDGRAHTGALTETSAGKLEALSTSDVAVIAIASGLIAIVAAIPGWPILLPETCDGAAKNGSHLDSPVVSAGQDPVGDGDTESEGEPPKAELSPVALAIERLGHAFLIGMLIRLAGTVALFLASSYYMPASPTQIGIGVLGWHLLLLFAEVITLSRQIRLPSST